MDEHTTRKAGKQRRRRVWPVAVLVIIVLALLAAGAWFVFGGRGDQPGQPGQPDAEPTAAPLLEIDPNAGALVTPTPAPQEPGVAIPGWGSMTIPAGVTEVQTSMQNPESNEGWYYLTFELRLKDTGEVLFTTGLIPPGQYCNKVTLTRALEKGEYPAVIHVQPYRMSDQSPTNNADMETTLIVE